MLIQWVIWINVLFICVAIRPNNYRDEAAMGKSRKARHLQMELQVAKGLEKELIREKRSSQLHSWLSEAQKRELQRMESEGISKTEVRDKILEFYADLPANEKEKWDEKYKEECNEWIKTVASDDEIAQLKALRSGNNIGEYKAKLNEYKSRLPVNKKEEVNLWEDACNKLAGFDVQQKRLHTFRRDVSQYSGFAHILTSEQIALLEDMKADGVSDEDIERKAMQFYLALPLHGRKEIEVQFKAKCIKWIQEVTDDDEIVLLLNSFEKGNRLIFNTLLDEYFERFTKKQQNELQHLKESCREMWRELMDFSRLKRSVNEEYHEWISWMTDEQKNELQSMRDRGLSFNDIHKEVNGYFIKLPETMQKQLMNDYKEKCQKYFLALANKDEARRLNAAYDEVDRNQYKKIIDEILRRQHQDVREKAYKFYWICDDIYQKQLARSKRDVDALMEKHLSWLAPEQKAEIKQMKESGESLAAIKQKLFSYIQNMGIDEQQSVTEKTKQSCYAWLHEVTSAAERAELENLHQTNHSACKKKVREYIKRLSPEKQAAVNRDLAVCEHIWYREHEHHKVDGQEHHNRHHHHGHHVVRRVRQVRNTQHANIFQRERQHHHHMEERDISMRPHRTSQNENNNKINADNWIQKHMSRIFGDDRLSRRKRHEHQHRNLDHYFKTHLSWLTKDQKEFLKKMKFDGKSKADMQNMVMAYYEDLDVDNKKRASKLLQKGCHEMLEHIVGVEKITELKAMKDSGAPDEELKAKVDKMLDGITDKDLTKKIHDYGPVCRKIFETSLKHNKEDSGKHTLEDYFKSHLRWLSDSQKEEIRKMKQNGKSQADMQKILLSFYEEQSGEQKNEATDQLRDGCNFLLKKILGDEKVNELKKLRDSGSTVKELRARIDVMFEHVTDEAKKQKAYEYGPICRKVYAEVHDRHKRDHDHHLHKLEDYFKTQLSWLTDDEKNEIRKMKEEGKSKADIQKKVFGYYESLVGDRKKEASEILRGSCTELLKQIVGDEKVAEIKRMKEGGMSLEQLRAKVDELLEHVTDETKKQKAHEYGPICRKVYAEVYDRHKRDHHGHQIRKRREDNEKHSLEDYFHGNLKWLSTDQKNELIKMKEDGKSRAELTAKVFHFYDELSEEAKHSATELLHDGCRHILKEVIGEEEYEKLKKMKDSGTSEDDLKSKTDALLDKVTDEEKKEKIKIYRPGCGKVFAAIHHKHSLEEYFKGNLKWLTEEQRSELRKMKNEGSSKADIREKILHFYEGLSGEAKEQAGGFLYKACCNLIKHVVGDEKAAELKKMKESGATVDEIKHKLEIMIEEVKDQDKKAKAKEYGPSCQKIISEHHHKHTLEHYFRTHLKWLSKEQKEEIKKMKHDKLPVTKIQEKVFTYLDHLEDDAKCHAIDAMYDGCRELLHHVLGDEKYEEIKKMKESGAAKEELTKKVEALLEQVNDEHKKEQIKRYESGCKKVFEMKQEHKDHNHDALHSLEHYLEHHLKWLTDSQKEELKKMKDENKPTAEIVDKVTHYYEKLKGDEKNHITRMFEDSCRQLLKDTVGEEKYAEFKKFRESGPTVEKLEERALALAAEVKDEAKKKRFDRYKSFCSKISKDLHQRHDLHSLEDYLEHHLKWLTDSQKEELKKMKDEKKPTAEMVDKVTQYYEKLKGDEKNRVTRMFEDSCRQVLKDAIGEGKYAELKKFWESRPTIEELEERVLALAAEITDEEKKKRFDRYKPFCSKISKNWYQKHLLHSLDYYFEHELKWLTEEEKKEVKHMEKEGKTKKEIHDKVMDFYRKAEGKTKEEATDLLKKSCKEWIRRVLGEEHAEELKSMKEAGKSFEEIDHKFDEFVENVTDENMKADLKIYGPSCKEVFRKKEAAGARFKRHTIPQFSIPANVAALSRMKRSHLHQTLENYFTTHLKWLTEEQQDVLRQMKAEGKNRAEIQSKIFEFFESASGETKKLATQSLREGCHEFFKEIGGEDKAHELDMMVRSNVASDKIDEKIAVMIESMKDESEVRMFAAACKQLYAIRAGKQKRDFPTLPFQDVQ